MSEASFGALDAAGLNLQAIFELDDLPRELLRHLGTLVDEIGQFRQLILIGNGGRRMWSVMKAGGVHSEDPIDDFSVRTAQAWLTTQCPGVRHRLLYPGPYFLDLQRLGELAGWHHPSPFMVGIQAGWGSWFAYRVAMLADTALPATERADAPSPCDACSDRPCVASCPAGAMSSGAFSLDACAAYRMRPDSRCAASCVARVTCPVGREHRYTDEQMAHSYTISLRAMEQYL